MTVADLMTEAEFAELETLHGPAYPCWELFDRWLTAWREAHPEDERDELELSVVYADWPEDKDIAEAPTS